MDRDRIVSITFALVCACQFDSSAFGDETSTGTSNGTTTDEPSTTSGSSDVSTDEAASSSTSSSESTDDGSTSTAASSTTEDVARCIDDWWNLDWRSRRQLTVAGTGLEEPLHDAMVLLRLDAERIDYDAVLPGGNDLRFTLDDVELAYDIEHWDPTGESVVWIHVPTLQPEATAELFMYYGNAEATIGADPAATWAYYVSVHHMEDTTDATHKGHDAILLGAQNPPTPTAGHVAGAYTFDSGPDGDAFELPNESDYDFTATMTIELLLRVDGFEEPYEAIVTKGGNYAWRLHRGRIPTPGLDLPTVAFSHDPDNENVQLIMNGDTAVDDDDWHYIAATFDMDTGMRLFIDGVLEQEAIVEGPISQRDEPVMFGRNPTFGPGVRDLNGSLDEVRITDDVRPPGYFAWQWAALQEPGVVEVGQVEVCELPGAP